MRRRFPSARSLLFAVLLAAGVVRLALVVERWKDPPAWDERINSRNLSAIHQAGAYRPQNRWYGGLSYLPQALLLEFGERLHRTVPQAPAMFGRRNVVTAAGFSICLALQAAYGVASLALLARLARRFVGEWGATIATAVVAALPQHLHASSTFKPDILLLVTTLWTLDRTFAALGRPSARRFAWVGLGIGLTAATKLNGAVVATPLIVGAAVWMWRRRGQPNHGQARRRFLGLALLAAALSLATFTLLTPDVAAQLRWARRGVDLYRYKAKKAGEAEGFSPLRMLGQVADPIYLGRAGGALAGVSAIWWFAAAAAATARKGLGRPGSRSRVLILAAFPAAYLLQFAASPRAKPNHLLEIAPLAVVAAVVVATWGLRRVRRWPRWRPVVVPVALGLCLTAQGLAAARLAAEEKPRLRRPAASRARPAAVTETPAAPAPPAGRDGS